MHDSSYDVIILGAGAAGLMCAMTAARRGRRVMVLEKANKPGKKILMSGGGRCNFTNHFVAAENYLSANPHFCKAALSRYTQWDFIAMVERHGIEYEERKHSQLFCKHSAKDILKMLLQECESAGVALKTRCDISSVAALDSGEPSTLEKQPRYRVVMRDDEKNAVMDCASLVVATGALSVPTLGGSGVGYDIATQFSLALTERQAGLVPFMFSDATRDLCEHLSGVSLPVAVHCNQQSFMESILFTHRGISGPAILQISNYWHPGDELIIDLLPELNATDWLVDCKHTHAKILLKTLLNKKLPRALVTELQRLWWPGSADARLAQFSEKQLTTVGEKLNAWRLKPSTTEGYRTAEVTLGGVDTAGISSKTMEAKQQPGLFFIGEVMDVTGQLGGFNFQWAWSSGYSAGLFV